MSKISATVQRTLFANHGLRLLFVGVCVCHLAGCGGGALSQEDMKRMSRRHPASDEDEQPAIKIASEEQSEEADKAGAKTKQRPGAEAKSLPTPKTAPQAMATQEVAPTPQKDPPTEPAKHANSKPARAKPSEPLTFAERCKLTASNLDRISAAMEAYREDKGVYPPPAILGASKAQLLSWRVELLPYLGFVDLYKEFDLTKPWNSRVNKPLIDKIPSVFQSPERFDTKTNYLLVTGFSTVFPGTRTVHARKVEDGIEHCALVLEVDNRLATPWTKPEEYKADLKKPKRDLGKLRKGDTFVIWGGGMTGALPVSTRHEDFRAMYTIDSGERFSSYSVNVPIDDDYIAALSEEVSKSSGSSAASQSNFSNNRHTRSGPNGNAATADNGLAGKFVEAARTSLSMNQPSDALLWYYASNLVQPESIRWDTAYQWVPALQRPSPTVHFCVGVRGSGTRGSSSRAHKSSRRKDNGRNELASMITPVGEDFLKMIEDHAGGLFPPTLVEAPANQPAAKNRKSRAYRSGDVAMPMTYLGAGTRSRLTTEATARGGDVLVLFEVKPPSANTGKWVGCELIDLARGKSIVKISRIHWHESPAALEELQRAESYKRKRWKLEDTLEDRLSLSPWPDRLKSKHIAARVGVLAKSSTLNKLIALTELSVYRKRGLIDTQELLQGFRKLIGDLDGEVLMLGSDKKRKRVLRNWLPEVEPEELQQLAQRRRNDDND